MTKKQHGPETVSRPYLSTFVLVVLFLDYDLLDWPGAIRTTFRIAGAVPKKV